MASPWQSPGGITSPWGTMVAGPEGKLRSFLEADGVLQDVEVAGRAVSEALERDVQASGLDLADALDPSRLPLNPYSTQPKDWPPPVDIASAHELPPVLIERYTAAGGQGTALCGIFPQLRRAWATVDNSLFLWSVDRWDGTYIEYSGEEQAICAVGLTKPKPGVFIEAIQYLLVLATPVEIILLGVCLGPGGGAPRPSDDLTLQPLPEYTVSSDGVTMCCITASEDGRIFMGGRDGQLHELLYSTGSGWQKRCQKVTHAGGLANVLARWVVPSVFRFGTPDPLVELALDEERHILYGRTQASRVQVFDIGRDGRSAPNKVAEDATIGERGLGGDGGARGRLGAKRAIVSIATVTTAESQRIQLVATAIDGRRIYLSTVPAARVGAETSQQDGRPSTLSVVTTRQGPPAPPGPGLGFTGQSTSGVKAEAAHYSSGLFLLSDASQEDSSRLIICTRDNTISSQGGGFAYPRTPGGLREVLSVLPVEGRTLATADELPPPEVVSILEAGGLVNGTSTPRVGELTRARRLWAGGELATQHVLPRRKAVVVSSTGTLRLVVNRPVDVLRRLLEGQSAYTTLREFFVRYGTGEAAAMCLLLAAGLAGDGETPAPAAVAERAAEAFEDPNLVDVPKVKEDGLGTSGGGGGSSFDMGRAISEPVLQFSAAYEGLCLVSARLLKPVWRQPVVVDRGGIIASRLPPAALHALESKIRSLEQFLRSRRNHRRGFYARVAGGPHRTGYGPSSPLVGQALNFDGVGPSGSGVMAWEPTPARGAAGGVPKRPRMAYSQGDLAAMEVRAMECMRRLLRRSAEALLLLRLLAEHNLARLLQSLREDDRKALAQLSFQQLVCTPEGDRLATQLIAALMHYYVSGVAGGGGVVEELSAQLRQGCPSYFNEADRVFYQAVENLQRAAGTGDPVEQRAVAQDALRQLAQVPDTLDLAPVCRRFEALRFYEGVVELPLRKAQAVDPAGDATNERIDPERRTIAVQARDACYQVVTDVLKTVVSGKPEFAALGGRGRPQMLPPATRKEDARALVGLAMRQGDRLFHERIYQALMDLGMEQELLELAAPDLEMFLRAAGGYRAARTGPRSGGAQDPSAGAARQPITSGQARYLELLSRYYVHKRHFAAAAHVNLRLAERRQPEGETLAITLQDRENNLSSAVLQAKSQRQAPIGGGTAETANLLNLLEDKLTVLRFQRRIYEELRMVAEGPMPEGEDNPDRVRVTEAGRRAEELGAELKNVTQLYNDYAVPFQLWETSLEILHFSSYDGDSGVLARMWERLIAQGLEAGGIGEAATRVRRVGGRLRGGGGGRGPTVPLEEVAMLLETAAHERSQQGQEMVRDDEVPRALLGSSPGNPEPVYRAYERLLARHGPALGQQPELKLRLLTSVLVVLREWASASQANVGTAEVSAKKARGIISSACNRFRVELQRVSGQPEEKEAVARGFKELSDSLETELPDYRLQF